MKRIATGRFLSNSHLVWCLALTGFALSPLLAAAAASSGAPVASMIVADDTSGSQAGGGSGQANKQPLPGQLVVPGSPQQGQGDKNKKGKQCVTVCAQWGQECILVNQGAGGLQRRCRHVCKQFTEECY